MTTSESRPESRPENGSVRHGQAPEGVALSAEDITGLVKVAADSSIRLSAWAAVGGLRAARRIVAAIAEPAQAPELIEDFRAATASITHAVMGDGDTWVRRAGESNPIVNAVLGAVDAIAPVAPDSGGASRSANAMNGVNSAEDDDAVRDHARRLLQRSRDVHDRDTPHPAYLTIVRQLAPDELRILLLLLRQGAQPIVDVRPGGLGASAASPIARGLNMVGAMAGARYVERVPSYLHNLERLGLLEISNEVLRDPVQYSVLEAQPDVLAHLHANRRAKVSRRSLRLTPFGEDFLNVGLGLGAQPADGLNGVDRTGATTVEVDRSAVAEVDTPAPQPAAETLSPIIDIHVPQSASGPPAWPTAAAAAEPSLLAVLDEDLLSDEPAPDEALPDDERAAAALPLDETDPERAPGGGFAGGSSSH